MKLSHEEILELQADVFIDALVAKHFLKWIFYSDPEDWGWQLPDNRNKIKGAHWRPSLALNSAFIALSAWTGDFEVKRQNSNYKVTLFQSSDISEAYEATAETVTLAICRCVLLTTELVK